MKRVRVIVRARQPLVLGDGMTGRQNVRRSLDHIPGGMLRGAIAQRILEGLGVHHTSGRALNDLPPVLQGDFEKCFLRADGIRFGFLYPGEGETIPAPATALRCRQSSDHLFDALPLLLQGERWGMECPKCGGRLERTRGYLTRTSNGWQPVEMPLKRQYVRVGLSRLTETAETSILYVIEAIEPHSVRGGEVRPQLFSGIWYFTSNEHWEAFTRLMDAIEAKENRLSLRIGSARSRGFGLVDIEWHELEPIPLADRLKTYQQHLNRPVITLEAFSPVIVREAGRTTSALTPDRLRRYLPDLPHSVQTHEDATRVECEWVSGWSPAWGLPKPLTPAIAPGSVFTFTYDQNDFGALLQWLQRLEEQGIGERTREGYGQFAICPSFPLETPTLLKAGDEQ